MHELTSPSVLACPMDGLPLTRDTACWRCPTGHSFDIARQGYINLLPVQNKRSKDPGDSKEMVVARQEFLSAGYYQPIANAVSDLVNDCSPVDATVNILDAGCGEGYYLREFKKNALNNRGAALHLTGLDISKWAVISAARQDKTSDWIVGSNANLPLLPATQDVVLCLFGFPVYAEFTRVLKQNGVLIKVDAGPDHLIELREIIYPSVKTSSPSEDTPPGFTLLEQRLLRYTIRLTSQTQISRLLTMTPHLYRITAAGRARAEALTDLSLTVNVQINKHVAGVGGIKI
ncbi:methyltransferase domain-containing protein [Gammaproteobacteria bacterium LSUCC0112]|nr:methyltransferase domain-containing protein [Gammaproteobacteria bacterium LSUCC0112]